MKTDILIRVRRHFMHDMAPPHVARHNARQWVRSVRMLGDKWLLAQPYTRGDCNA